MNSRSLHKETNLEKLLFNLSEERLFAESTFILWSCGSRFTLTDKSKQLNIEAETFWLGDTIVGKTMSICSLFKDIS